MTKDRIIKDKLQKELAALTEQVNALNNTQKEILLQLSEISLLLLKGCLK